MQYLLALAFGYLGGSIPTAYILARVTKHVDIRKVGSGNVGGSNVAAQVGLLPSIATMLFDLVKGALAVAILRRYDFPLEAQVLAGVAAVLGHNWPFWLGFVGGRGIATTGGVLFMFGPLETLLAGIVIGLGWGLFHQGAIATLVAFALWPLLAYAFGEPPSAVVCGAVMFALIVARRLQGSPGLKRSTPGENVWWNRLWLDRDIRDEAKWVQQKP
ncbi:MAG: glycerol-3-phosphate acyltransferase [Chloroflexi bacterium]|nr:MAG: glycerol-3-phosphate acyltransferase [Chloroflexota bacterium]